MTNEQGWADLAGLLKQGRERRAWSLRVAAKRADISPATWKSYESGLPQENTSSRLLARAADAVGVDPALALSWVGRKFYPEMLNDQPEQEAEVDLKDLITRVARLEAEVALLKVARGGPE